jgi:DNA-binding response OmpR family regulator/signal transduction histidine kinase/streptogramin lyase
VCLFSLKRQGKILADVVNRYLPTGIAGLICIFVVGSPIASYQDNLISLEHVNSKHGLPQNSVRSLGVDHDGFVWVGTEKGLARFDGRRFINFSKLNKDIPVDVSLGLQVDSRNRIWTTWYTHSIRVLSSNRQDVLVIKPAKSNPDDLDTRLPPRIVEPGNGKTWFPGLDHIYRIDEDDAVSSIPTDLPASSAGIVVNGSIVYGTRSGLMLINVETEEIRYVNIPPNDSDAGGLNTFKLVGLKDAVIFCHSTGVFRYTFETETLRRLTSASSPRIGGCDQLGPELLIETSEPHAEVVNISTLNMLSAEFVANPAGLPDSVTRLFTLGLYGTFQDTDDNRWVLLGDTLYHALGAGVDFRILDFPNMPFDKKNLFAQDLSGTIWARTDDNGLAKFSPYSQRFQTTVVPSGIARSSRIRSMAVDKDNNVWLVSGERKLLYWNRLEQSWVDKLPGNTRNIKGIEILPDDSVWIILPGQGKLLGYDSISHSWKYEFQFDAISTAIAQSRDGQLIFASSNQVFLLSSQTGQMKKITRDRLKGQIRALTQDSAGDIWVGTHEAGLAKIDTSGHVQYWNTDNSAISSDNIFSLHFGSTGVLWIGTWHGGLNSFNTVTNEFKHYDQADGLPDSTIFGILEDRQGHLWLSSYSGLIRFTPCSNTDCQPETRVFTKEDGLQGDEFDADSHFKSDNGEMFFAGMGGLNAFFPVEFRLNKKAPPVRLSRAQLDEGPLPGAESEFVFPESVDLPFDFGQVRLEVSVLDFHIPEKNRLQYRDLNTGNTWKDMQQPFLLLHGLQDGTHTFEFRGSNSDGVWSTQNASIKLLVAPPLYSHPLMLTFYLLMATLFPVVYFRRKQTRFIANQQSLERQVARRTRELELANTSRERFFANVSHEICSPVHMILLMLENHMSTATGEDREIYKSATGYAAQLMVYLKQLVSDARSHEVDSRLYAADIGKIIHRLVLTNQPIARTRSIALQVEPMPKEQVAFYTSSAISIFSNLLCNALVYTPESGSIQIAGNVIDQRFIFTISNTTTKDQSVDIKTYLKRGSRGDFDANYFGGHGLGLSIVTSAIEILGGSIDVDLLDECRIVFRIELPLATSIMPGLPDLEDLAFSHEQMLAIKLINDDTYPANLSANTGTAISVLIIEDDALVANLISQSLAKSYQVFVAGSYKEGIELVYKQRPNAILCDLFLPDKSGFDVLKDVRSNRMSMNTFFVMITASISEEDRVKSQQLGVDRFVRKPVSAENLKLLIENHISLSEQRIEHRHKEKLIRKTRLEDAQNKRYPFKKSFSQVLEELYQDPDTSIESLQIRMSLGYSALLRNCKQAYGKAPKRLLIEKRITAAKSLLGSSDYSIGVISELTGFSTHSQFTIVFKKETGMTPLAYRKNPDSIRQ